MVDITFEMNSDEVEHTIINPYQSMDILKILANLSGYGLRHEHCDTLNSSLLNYYIERARGGEQ